MRKLRFPKDFLAGGEQRALLFLAAFGILGLLLGQFGGQIVPLVSEPPSGQLLAAAVKSDKAVQIDLRTATREELLLLPGIGEKRAQDILDHRAQRPFASVRDLLEIKGIGEKTLAKLLPLLLPIAPEDGRLVAEPALILAQPASLGTAQLTGVKTAAAKPASPPKSQLTNIVNLNTADAAELCTLPGIGEVKAKAILDYRAQNGPFTAIEELLQVKGIGEKTLAKLRPRITL